MLRKDAGADAQQRCARRRGRRAAPPEITRMPPYLRLVAQVSRVVKVRWHREGSPVDAAQGRRSRRAAALREATRTPRGAAGDHSNAAVLATRGTGVAGR